MVAHADDLAVLDHQDQIRVTQGADSLGHQHGGGVAVIVSQGLAQIGIGLIVQSRGGIVQNENFRIGCQGSGDEEPLLLAAGEIVAPDHDLRFQLAFFFFNEFRLGIGCSTDDMIFGNIPEETDIVRNGALGQEVVLEYNTKAGFQILRYHSPDILAIN